MNPNENLKPTCKRRNRPTMKCRAKCCRKPKQQNVESSTANQDKLFLVGSPEEQLRNWRNRESFTTES